MRARMALLYADVKVILREVDLRDKPSQMLQASPKATVPVLILENGEVIEESLDIINWALTKSDKDGWLCKLDEKQLQIAHNIINENDGDFKKNLDQYKYADRFPEHSMQDSRGCGELFLAKLDALLKKHRYLLGSEISFVDVAVFPFVRQFAHVDKAWFDATGYAHLQQWLQQHLDSEYFKIAMKKTDKWEEASPEIMLGD